MITKELIEDRINNFWGYGNLNAPIWFIGLEEGFTGNLDDLEKRLLKTQGKSVLDCHADMLEVTDHIKFYRGTNPPLQSTTKKLIAILFYLKGKTVFDNDDIRRFQGTQFGRLNSDHCSLEFLPLPNNKSDSWIYDFIGIDYLSSRKKYEQTIFPRRIALFRDIIDKYSPKVVIFYTLKFKDSFESIIGKKADHIGEDVFACKKDNTSYFIITHPTATGLSNEKWEKISMKIKGFLD